MNAYLTTMFFLAVLGVSFRLGTIAFEKYPRERSPISIKFDVIALVIELAMLAWVSVLKFGGAA